MLQNFNAQKWDEHFPDTTQQRSIKFLEDGDVLFFPELAFTLSQDEKQFLTPELADPKSKNIGYHATYKKLWGMQNLSETQHQQLQAMLDRFSRNAFGLIKGILPRYSQQLTIGRTSFRPVEIKDRESSYRKDDKRLHVDAFPATPNQGKRILRVFCNINPNREDRVWRLGEPFAQAASRFVPQISKPYSGTAMLLRMLRITKSYRTLYDHYMLQMHDRMKADEAYQKSCAQQDVRFPPGSSWIVQTDHVSHAAMQGQYVLEQTFYLPVKAMQDETKSPLRILEKILEQPLV